MFTKSSTNWPQDVGIISIEIYFPNLYVDQVELEEFDGVSTGKYTIGLGQTKMGFTEDIEDIQSICLTVLKSLLEKNQISPNDVGFLMVGTETIIDKSKSIKTTLMQLFEQFGNTEIEGLDTTNACYGGTAALFHAINWIESSSWDGRYAIVVCGDLAVYEKGPARPTGGVGACAMLIGPNAPLVIARNAKAIYMSNVYDFYKPDLSSEYPIVQGKLSISCYLQALDKCYKIFKQRYETNVAKQSIDLNYFDGLIFHSPFCKLVQKSVARLVLNQVLLNPELCETDSNYEQYKAFYKLDLEQTYFDREVEQFFLGISNSLFNEKTKASLLLSTQVGNMYTASLYSCLISYLISKPIDKISNQKLLLFSYGSGMAATMYSITISSNHEKGSSLHKLIDCIQEVPTILANRIKVSPKEFSEIMANKEQTHHLAPYQPIGNLERLLPGTYYLESIDKTYKRTYKRKNLNPLSSST